MEVERLAEEMVRVLRGSGGDRTWPDRMVLTGPGTDEPALRSTLAGVCGMPVVPASSQNWMSASAPLQGDLWAAVAGSVALDADDVERRAA